MDNSATFQTTTSLNDLQKQLQALNTKIATLTNSLYYYQVGFLDLILIWFFWPFVFYVFYKIYKRSQLIKLIRYSLMLKQQLQSEIRKQSWVN